MSVDLRFAHLSDWHATSLSRGGAGLLKPKRLSGWASWRINRRDRHSPAILDAAIRDVRSQNVDQVLVTGDLTHVSLEREFRDAAEQLARLGTPDEVFVIPGNHDCYVSISAERSWDYWTDYLRGTDRAALDEAIVRCLAPADPIESAGRAPRYEDYPTLRIHGGLAVIGLCSAIPVPIFRAAGALGARQLERLECLLETLGAQGYARVVMLHHPVIATDESARRALRDAEGLRAVLERQGADLVVHGHKHRRRVHTLKGPDGEIPIVGVPSSSEVGSRPDKRAQYHLYRLRSAESGDGFRLDAEVRGYDAASGRFEHEESLF